MSNIRAVGRFRLALLATILLLVMVLAAGTLFAANERGNAGTQPAVESVALNGVDPGLEARPPVAEKVEPLAADVEAVPEAAIETAPGDGADPGAGQEVEGTGGTGALSRWLSSQPDEMGPFTTQDAMKADEIDVEWLLYQAVQKDTMTEQEAEDFRAWFSERPTEEEAPALWQQQPGGIYRPGDGDAANGISSGFKAY